METVLDKYRIIRNSCCVVCGERFKAVRANKFYCSPKCKQFYYYHKSEIAGLKQSGKGITDEYFEVSLKEYRAYSSIVKQVNEYHNLSRTSNSSSLRYAPNGQLRLEELETQLPQYLKGIKLPTLSIEEWSFFKILYPNLKKDNFLILLNNLGYNFFTRLAYEEEDNKRKIKNNSVKTLYKNHIFKIASGKLKFT
jgi:hypothetical protein